MLKDIETAIDRSNSLEDLFVNLGFSRNPNSRTRQKVRDALAAVNILDGAQYFRDKRSPKEVRVCPVCNSNFTVTLSDLKQDKKVTCSRACANTHFKSGVNNPNFKETSATAHRTLCFHYWGKACIVCGEDLIVEAHHIDEDRTNNSIDNLMPLCPTHHQYWHSKHRYIIQEIVDDYLADRNKCDIHKTSRQCIETSDQILSL